MEEGRIFCLSPEMGKKGKKKIEHLNQGKEKRNLSVRAGFRFVKVDIWIKR